MKKAGMETGIASAVLLIILEIMLISGGFITDFWSGRSYFSFSLAMIICPVAVVFVFLAFYQGRRGFAVTASLLQLIIMGMDDLEGLKAFVVMASVICSIMMTKALERAWLGGNAEAEKQSVPSFMEKPAIKKEKKPVSVNIPVSKAFSICGVIALVYILLNISTLFSIFDRVYLAVYNFSNPYMSILSKIFGFFRTFAWLIGAVILVMMKKPKVSISLTGIMFAGNLWWLISELFEKVRYSIAGVYYPVTFFGFSRFGFSFSNLTTGLLSFAALAALLVYEILFLLASRKEGQPQCETVATDNETSADSEAEEGKED